MPNSALSGQVAILARQKAQSLGTCRFRDAVYSKKSGFTDRQ